MGDCAPAKDAESSEAPAQARTVRNGERRQVNGRDMQLLCGRSIRLGLISGGVGAPLKWDQLAKQPNSTSNHEKYQNVLAKSWLRLFQRSHIQFT
jgi:hypothetical protein